ncbi:MAG: DUF192 domain-containing protein [Candidatus Omnitrophica bacterium]|nr:DUF192 domain-containing protein [Candidatus Omnitrophota bacterium]MBU2250924.1 DUF192 domain-containing protein [Candidatus Omnitrophota bacterium]MBU2265776.1 DUF192 domain-containing protein [Candidatus Omnitrophota bacterium]
MFYSIISKNKGSFISSKVRIASNFWLRFKGLMFDRTIDEKAAMVFYNAPAIHTSFMRFSIDIVFLDKNNKVIKICQAVKPWKIVFCRHSALAIELPAHRAKERSLELGDTLQITVSESPKNKRI